MRHVLKDYKFNTVDDSEVDYELESMNNVFGTHANTIPIQNAVQAARLFYGSRFDNQAFPIVDREVPLVQSLVDADPNNNSFDDILGRQMGAIWSDTDGVISDINDTHITITDANKKKKKYAYYKDFPLNRITGINNKLAIKKGDSIKKGQLLASSNYTDDNGTMAMGRNARIAIVPYKGYSLEDAIVISEDFAKKLRADTLTTHDMEFKRGVKNGKGHYVGLFPNTYTKKQLSKLDKNGVVQVGQVLEYGDPFVLATAPKIISSQDSQLGKLSSYMRNARRDNSLVWSSESPGIVTDVGFTQSGVKVNIKSEKDTKVGDKIVMRSGNKGVVSEILPSDQMPRTADGKPIEVLLNPMSIPSRVNASLIYELLLGKIAKKIGKPYKISTFNKLGEKWYDSVKQELEKNGLTDKENIFDPKENKWIDNPVTIGDAYVLKLHHIAEKKESHRGQGSYDNNRQPAKGGEDSAKRLSSLENYALLSAGATSILKEMSLLRGDENSQYWSELRRGGDPQLKNTPFAWNKFLGLLTGSGYHARLNKNGNLRLGPVTDSVLDDLNAQEILSGETLDLNTMKPIRGGLFDEALAFQNKWGYIPLSHPVPNPAFEDAILKILDLRKADFEAILKGEKELPENLLIRIREKLKDKQATTTEALPTFSTTGPEAIESVLNTYDVDSLEREAVDLLNTGKKTARNPALRKLQIVKGLRRNELQPNNLMLRKVPVLPVNFRPFNIIGDTFLLGDANMLYKDLMDIRNTNEEIRNILGDEAYNRGKYDTYEAVKATFGFRDPTQIKTKQHGVSGLLQKVTGKGSPKTSFPQKVLLSKPQDFTGRSVIVVDPELGMDEVGIPENMAWSIFSPHVQHRMVRTGIPASVALKEIQEKTAKAKAYLLQEMKERPVLYSRAPAWHKFNSIGGYAKLTDDNSIHTNMYMTSSATADFDGDQNISKVFVINKLHTLKDYNKNPKFLLTSYLNSVLVSDMIAKNIIPSFNTEENKLYLVDFEDFPHGEFLNSNDGEKGEIDFFYTVPGTKVVAFNEATNNLVWAEASLYSKHHQREIEIVNLSHNKQIITDDDPRAIYGLSKNTKDFSFERFTPTDAKANDVMIPSSKHIPKIDCEEMTEVEITKEECSFKKLPLDFDFGYVIGALVGDGWWDKREYSHFSNYKPYQFFFADLKGFNFKKLFKFFKLNMEGVSTLSHKDLASKIPNRYGDSVKYVIRFDHAKFFADFCKQNLGGFRDKKTTGSGNKKLPDFFLKAPKEFRLGLLCGLIDTDGSVSNTKAVVKAKATLQVFYHSTSLRLVRDVKLLASSLGCDATIGFGKTTIKGNKAWYVYFSSVDMKRLNLLEGLQTPSKKLNFTDGKVEETSASAVAQDLIPFPKAISKILQSKFSSVVDCENAKTMSTKFFQAKVNGYVSRNMAKRFINYLSELEKNDKQLLTEALNTLVLCSKDNIFTVERCSALRKGICTFKNESSRNLSDSARKAYATTNQPLKSKYVGEKFIKSKLAWFADQEYKSIFENLTFLKWVSIVENEAITWQHIESVEKTYKREDGYDLCVPGYETFLNIDGVVLSNTMNVHAPALRETVDEIKEKLMPSKMLFLNKTFDQPAYPLMQELILSLFTAQQREGQTYQFSSQQEALDAIKKGRIKLSDNIEILNK